MLRPGGGGGPGEFLIYRQEFRSDTGVDKNRVGIVGLLEPEGDPNARIFLLQDTEQALVARCTDAIVASGLQENFVVGVVEDTPFQIEKIAEEIQARRPVPDIQLVLPGGERHQLWRVTGPDSTERIRGLFWGKDCLLLDGLHTYKALRRLRSERKLVEARPLTVLYNVFDFGLGLGAASILLKGVAHFSINDIALRLSSYFEISTYPFEGDSALPQALAGFRDDFRVRGFTDNVVGGFFRGVDQFFLFRLREGAERESMFLPDVKPALQEFDAVILHHVFLERYLGDLGEGSGSLEYCWSMEEAVSQVRGGGFQAALFVNAPNRRKLFRLARAQLRLPPGAARVEPPLRRLIVHRVGLRD